MSSMRWYEFALSQERNLHDCLAVAKNIFQKPKLLPGGGAVEMELSARLLEKANRVEGLG